MLLKLVAIPVDVSRILQKKSVEAVDLVDEGVGRAPLGAEMGSAGRPSGQSTSSAVTQKWIFPESFERRWASY
jgi:hypothetical protein